MLLSKQKTKKPNQTQATPAKKRRKPQDRTKLTRNSLVQIRLTTEEVATLKATAKENEMSLADFVMSAIHQKRRILVPGAKELRLEIIQVGNNLNQALKMAHILRKEGRPVDTAGIERSADQIEIVLDKLQEWLIMWDAYLTYQNKKGEK